MKTVLITGANRGIGLASVEKFLSVGYDVIFTARNREKSEQAIKSLKNKDRIHFYQLDVSSNESVIEACALIKKDFESIDVLINNAAINYDTWHNALNADLNEIEHTLDVNIMGAWRMIQAFGSMISVNGHIINMSSGAGSINSMGGGTPGYSVSKAALNALTVNVSHVLKDVYVNALCPGWVRTDMGGKMATRSKVDAAEDIYQLTLSKEFNGKFVRYGQVIEF